jgi:hypothetical protein
MLVCSTPFKITAAPPTTDSLIAQILRTGPHSRTVNEHGTKSRYTKANYLLIQIESLEAGIYKNVRWLYEKNNFIYSETEWIDNRGKVFEEKIWMNKECISSWIRNGVKETQQDSLQNALGKALLKYTNKIRNE